LLLLVISFAAVDRIGVQRFSSIAVVAIATVVASGTLQGVRQVGSLDALTGTSYGKLLIWKLVCVAGILGVAAVARQATLGRLTVARPLVGASVSAAAADDGFDRARLRKAITIESVIAVAVVIITSFLMAANPSEAAASAPFSTTLTSNGYISTITVAPARVGTNEIHIFLSSPNSSLDQPDALSVTIQDPSRDVDPIAIDTIKAGAGHWISNAATFPYAATWQLVVKARYGFNEVVFTADVKIV
jgi:copper transport protein